MLFKRIFPRRRDAFYAILAFGLLLSLVWLVRTDLNFILWIMNP